MNREEKLEHFKNLGYTYDPETGIVKNRFGKIINHGTTYKHISTRFNKNRISVRVHQFAWYMYYNEVPNVIDHINRIKDDNRICNLRNGTQSTNMFNIESCGSYLIGNKYVSKITVNNKSIYLGNFNTKEEAHQAYLDAKKIYHNPDISFTYPNKKEYNGYYYNKLAKKYYSRIQINKKTISLGYFNTKEEAHEAYVDAKKIYHII